jgi:DNA-binding MarR family transcriptional regulator
MSTMAASAFKRERKSRGGAAPGTTAARCTPTAPACPETIPDMPPAGPAPCTEDAVRSTPPTWEETPLENRLAAGLRRLSQWVHTQGWRHWATRRLTPTQLKVVGILFARPQGVSLTQVARELGSTAATVCDSVKALRKKGYVTGKKNPQDGREHTLRLTPKGQAIAQELLTEDPLLEGFAGLTSAEQQRLQVLWMKMIHALETSGALPPSRMCVRCQFFQAFCAPDAEAPHYCGQAQQPLAAQAVRFDCPVFEAAPAPAQAALWEAFVDGTLKADPPVDGAPPRAPHASPSNDGHGPRTAGSSAGVGAHSNSE